MASRAITTKSRSATTTFGALPQVSSEISTSGSAPDDQVYFDRVRTVSCALRALCRFSLREQRGRAAPFGLDDAPRVGAVHRLARFGDRQLRRVGEFLRRAA